MILGILKEPALESRVAMAPGSIAALEKLKIGKILVETGAGLAAYFNDQTYTDKGAIISDRASILKEAHLILCIHPLENSELEQLSPSQALLGQFNPLQNTDFVEALLNKNLSAFSLDTIPRTTRAQAMDVLSSMATASGYQAILRAATLLPRFFPMFMTAAGTIKPAKILILGAGVAGLQAIATARRLGGVVEAFDVRSAAKEEVLSLGAKFVEVEGAVEDKSAGGYAIEQTDDFKKRQAALIQTHCKQSDVVICTAQIPGRRAPLLIEKATVEAMKPGSVIVDLAASTGGNCEVTENGKTIQYHQINIMGESNLPASIPSDTSNMYSKNIINFLKILLKDGEVEYNFEDDLITGTCIAHQGNIHSERVKRVMTAKA